MLFHEGLRVNFSCRQPVPISSFLQPQTDFQGRDVAPFYVGFLMPVPRLIYKIYSEENARLIAN